MFVFTVFCNLDAHDECPPSEATDQRLIKFIKKIGDTPKPYTVSLGTILKELGSTETETRETTFMLHDFGVYLSPLHPQIKKLKGENFPPASDPHPNISSSTYDSVFFVGRLEAPIFQTVSDKYASHPEDMAIFNTFLNHLFQEISLDEEGNPYWPDWQATWTVTKLNGNAPDIMGGHGGG